MHTCWGKGREWREDDFEYFHCISSFNYYKIKLERENKKGGISLAPTNTASPLESPAKSYASSLNLPTCP